MDGNGGCAEMRGVAGEEDRGGETRREEEVGMETWRGCTEMEMMAVRWFEGGGGGLRTAASQ